MSTTTFPHRVVCIVPASRQATVQTWWSANADVNDGGTTFNVPLSANGSLPATAYWMSTALDDATIVALLRRLATLASITVPTGASLATKAQKIAWIANNGPTILSTLGIYVARDDEDGANWTDPESLLQTLGLQRISAGVP